MREVGPGLAKPGDYSLKCVTTKLHSSLRRDRFMGKSKHIVPKDDPQVTDSLGGEKRGKRPDGEGGSGKTPFPQSARSLMAGSPTTSKHHPALALQSALPEWGRTAARADVIQTLKRGTQKQLTSWQCNHLDHV